MMGEEGWRDRGSLIMFFLLGRRRALERRCLLERLYGGFTVFELWSVM
jgi:hypothetical protein